MSKGSANGGPSDVLLEGESLRAAIAPLGAELLSLRRNDRSEEYLWPGDARYWSRSAPHLFPIVGRLRGDAFTHCGRTYRLGQHGFARDRVFEVIDRQTDRAQFELRDDEETRAVYPFRFRLEITFQMVGAALQVGYVVDNPGDQDLLFSIGGHPGFRCPLSEGEMFDDYQVHFERSEHAVRSIVEEGLISDRAEILLDDTAVLPLGAGLFDRGALVFKDLASRTVLLRGRSSGRGVELRFPGFRYFAIWSKPGAPFVCLEPWCGIADSPVATGRLEDKEGIVRLTPGQRFSASYSIRPI